MRYEWIEGLEEIMAGAGGKAASAEEVESEITGMGNALTAFFKAIMTIIDQLKEFLKGK